MEIEEKAEAKEEKEEEREGKSWKEIKGEKPLDEKEVKETEEKIKLEAPSLSFEKVGVEFKELEEEIEAPEVELISLEAPSFQEEMAKSELKPESLISEFSLPTPSGMAFHSPSFSFINPQILKMKGILEEIRVKYEPPIPLRKPSYKFKLAQKAFAPVLLSEVTKISEASPSSTEEEGQVKTEEAEIGEAIYAGLLDLLFEPEEKDGIQGILKVAPERPVLIFAEKTENEDYLEVLKHIFREVYRIKAQELPKPVVIGTDKRKIEEVKVEERIVTIDDREAGFFESFGLNNIEKSAKFEEKADPEKFLERVGELFSQHFGFLILYGSEERLSRVKEILAPVVSQIPKYYQMRLKNFNSDRKSEVASSVWGFVEPAGITGRSFDDSFLMCKNLFWDSFDELIKTPKYAWVRESVEDEEGIEGHESSLHYLTKVFVVKYLWKKFGKELGITPENVTEEIKTECSLSVKGEKAYPDVYVPDKRLVIEVETLYGSGSAHWRRLKRTIEKYENSEYKLWLVVPNLQMSLYLDGIRKLAKKLKEKPVKFYTLNVGSDELIELGKYHNRLLDSFNLG